MKSRRRYILWRTQIAVFLWLCPSDQTTEISLHLIGRRCHWLGQVNTTNLNREVIRNSPHSRTTGRLIRQSRRRRKNCSAHLYTHKIAETLTQQTTSHRSVRAVIEHKHETITMQSVWMIQLICTTCVISLHTQNIRFDVRLTQAQNFARNVSQYSNRPHGRYTYDGWLLSADSRVWSDWYARNARGGYDDLIVSSI